MPQSKEQKQQTAKKLQEARAQRTAAEQIAILDGKFGAGKGAKKERSRLQNSNN